MNMSIKDRIYEYLDYKGSTPTKAERELGWGVGSITKIKSISADRLKDITLLYSDLSAEWLLRGKGDMILKEDNIPVPASVDHDELVALRAENRVLRELLNLRSSEKKMETA